MLGEGPGVDHLAVAVLRGEGFKLVRGEHEVWQRIE